MYGQWFGSALLAVLIGLTGCDPATSRSSDAEAQALRDIERTHPSPLVESVIMPPSDIPAILNQCSRSTPAAGEAGYLPGAEEIVALEAALPAAVAAAMAARPGDRRQTLGTPPTGWRVQYVGLIRDGRRYVYGNFFPDHVAGDSDWQETPMDVCDGGPDFFGVEFDVQAGRISHLSFNGMV